MPKCLNTLFSSPPDITCQHSPRCLVPYASHPVLPCRVWGARSVVPRAARLLRPYWPRVCRAAQELLGACPAPRVELLIYPESVQDMALAKYVGGLCVEPVCSY